jgi:hypothetical protein
MGTVTSSVWQGATMKCKVEEPMTDLFIEAAGGDERLTDQGQIYLWVLNPVSSNSALNLEVEYDLVLWIPHRSDQLTAAAYQGSATSSNSPNPTAQKLWNRVNSSITNSYAVNGTNRGLGDTQVHAFVTDLVAQTTGIKMPGGIWTLAQLIRGNFSVAPAAGGNMNIDFPTIVCNDIREVDMAEVVELENTQWTSDGTSTIYQSDRTDLLVIPPSGATIYGQMQSAGSISSQSQSSGKMGVFINPSSLGLASDNSLLLPAECTYSAWKKFGKHGEIARRKMRKHFAQFAEATKRLNKPVAKALVPAQALEVAAAVCVKCRRYPCSCGNPSNPTQS